jgi:ketopantoate reductase
MSSSKASVLLVGGGAVGTIAAVNIEAGGLGAVTLVARSNYQQVKSFGYEIESIDHGRLKAWRPTHGAWINRRDLISFYHQCAYSSITTNSYESYSQHI